MTRRGRKEPSQRQLRVAELIRHALAEIFERDVLHDADLVGVSITVTEVDISPDLKVAKVFVAPLGGGDAKAVLAGLRRGASFLRTQISRSMSLKYSPRLSFEIDDTFDQAGRIDALLKSPRVAQDLDRDDDRDFGDKQQDREES
ncbi:MAG: 30S ribosome-binding factor RbfA [Sphingomonadales bacterium]